MITELSDDKFYSLSELYHAFKRRDVNPSEIVDFYISNIKKTNPTINAFETIYEGFASREARLCDEAFSLGQRKGPFHGIPFVLKDICELKGAITTGGSALFKTRKSRETATIANRLLSAGGILLGKTKTVEFAFGGWGTNQKMGTPKNPWDSENHRICGGSSAGSAAALAANMTVCAIGTDTGGSVRLPVAFCGLTGLKVTKDLLPTDGILPLSHTFDTPGPMARSLLDMLIMFEVLRGVEGYKIDNDIEQSKGVFSFLTKNLKGVRVGIIDNIDRKICSEDVLNFYDKIVSILERNGAIICSYSPPIPYSEISARMSKIIAAEAYFHHGHLYENMGNPMDEHVRERVLTAKGLTANQYIKLIQDCKRAEKEFSKSMEKLDVLLTPTVTSEAPLFNDVDQSISPGYFTRPINYAGMCALSLPMGISRNGLPLSVQVAGRPYCEKLTIQVGATIEQELKSIF